jgi:hypothetical protein
MMLVDTTLKVGRVMVMLVNVQHACMSEVFIASNII